MEARKIISWCQKIQRRAKQCALVVFGWGIGIKVVGALGFLKDVGPSMTTLWSIISWLGPFSILLVIAAIHVLANWDSLKNKWLGAPFTIRPISGDTHAHSNPEGVSARLAIKNTSGKVLEECRVLLVNAFPIHYGQLRVSSKEYPSVNAERGESFYLRWKDKDAKDPKCLTIPPDGAERLVDVVSITDGRPTFAAADPSDLEKTMTWLGNRTDNCWCKLQIKISCKSGENSDFDLIVSCGDDPGPIILDFWSPRGENVLKQLANSPAF